MDRSIVRLLRAGRQPLGRDSPDPGVLLPLVTEVLPSWSQFGLV